MGEVKRRHGHWWVGRGGGGFVITSGFIIKVFSQVTFTVLHISFVNIKGYFNWQKPSHVTFSPRVFFCFLFFYCNVFSQLKNKHCNINIEVSFFLPYGREILRTVHWDKTNVKKFSFGQNKRYKKMYSFSFRSPNSSFLTGDSYMSWSTKFFSLKICVGFSIFDSVLILLNFIFLFNQKHLKIKIIENPHAILPSSLWFLSSNKFENLKIKNETNFLNSKIWSFE